MSKTRITAEPGMPQIVITREFDAPRDLVFRAFTDPELLAQWLGPRDLAMTVDRYEVRDGATLVRTVTALTATENRDAMIASGMERGVRDSDERLEELLATLRAGEPELS